MGQVTTLVTPGKIAAIKGEFPGDVIDGYVLYLPKSYDRNMNKLKKYPVLIFLQGGLGVGGEVIDLANWGLLKSIKESSDLDEEIDQYRLDSFIVVGPHMKEGSFEDRQFYNQGEAITNILNDLGDEYRIDDSRIYISGLSRGGHGTWGLGSKMSHLLAAIAPICGGLEGVENWSSLSTLPIWAAHNTGDDRVDYTTTTTAVKRIESITKDKFEILSSSSLGTQSLYSKRHLFSSFEREGHDAWTEMYESVDLYKWLLKQRRRK